MTDDPTRGERTTLQGSLRCLARYMLTKDPKATIALHAAQGSNDPARGVHLRSPWLCHLFGHRWRTFDRNWCGKDYQICQRMGFFPLKICGAVRHIQSGDTA